MRRVAVVLAVLAAAVGSAAAPAAAQAPPTVNLGPATTSERADPSVPLPCAPSSFPRGGYTGPCYLEFPVLVDPPGSPVTFTVEFTAGSASSGDFTSFGPITFPGTGCICLVVTDDDIGEAHETVTATIVDVQGGVAGEQASVTGTVLDDDPPTDRPDIGVLDRGTESVLLGWDPVTPVRGTLTGYTVTVGADNAPPQFQELRVGPDETTLWVSGLEPDGTYHFDIHAQTDREGQGLVNQVTDGPDAAGPAPRAPDPPVVTASTAGDGFVTVEWAPPASTGAVPIVAYSVVALSAGGGVLAWRNVEPGVRSASIDGLANGAPVDVHVLAWNEVGPAATAAIPLTPSAGGGAPQAPAAVPFVEVDGRPILGDATVTWSAAPERGRPVTGYAVILSERVGGTLGLVEWRTVDDDVRSVEFADLEYCHYDVHVVPIGTSGFGAAAVQADLVLPPPLTSVGFAVCQTPP